jgi:hypothetical protein
LPLWRRGFPHEVLGTFGSEKFRGHFNGIVAAVSDEGQSSSFFCSRRLLDGARIAMARSRASRSEATPDWRGISSKNAMPVFSGANLLGGLIFGSIGFVAFIYGKRMHIWKPMFIGLALMAYPYFVENDVAMFAIGVVGTAALFLFRE